jgi:hypothetical protein
MLVLGVLLAAGLRFAWPAHAEAQVELTDVRSVGDERRTIVMTMRLSVEPDAGTDRVVVRLSDSRLKSIDGSSPGDTDPAHTLLAVGRVMKHITPTMVISRDGRYLDTRDVDRLARDVLGSVGLPSLPVGSDAFANLLSDIAVEDWSTWVGAWLGKGQASDDPSAHARLTASAVSSSDAVRTYTQGFLIDMAREAKELGDNDPVASMRFLETAVYSPMTTTLTVELETATMRPLFAERTRTFSAVKGKHKVEGRERRTHRFTWAAEGESSPPTSTRPAP